MKHLNKFSSFIFEQLLNDIEMKEFTNIDIENSFTEADILESIVTDSDTLLKSIKAEEVDLFQTFTFNPDKMKSNFTINELYNNDEFNNSLLKKDLKKSELESTEETETFIDDTIVIKFFSIFNKNKSELERPNYIIYQSKKKSDKNWDNVKCYKVNDDMKHFYNKLTNKSIEIKKGNKIYIYQTSNSGNDWLLQKNKDNQNDKTFKEYLTSQEIKTILTNDDVSITIIA